MLFNQASINNQYVKMRWGEPRVTTGLNQKNFGVWPDGCYSGFTIGPGGLGPRDIIVGPGSVSGNVSPGVSGVGYMDGNFDATIGYSIAVVNDFQGFSNTVQIPPGPTAITHLDATGLEGKTVFIILKVEYDINTQTTAELALVDGAYIDANPWVVVLGNCQVPPSPSTPLDGSMFQYADPVYPRKTALGSPQRAGLMPPYVWAQLQQNMPWQNLLVMDFDINNAFNFTITPSQFTANGKRLYTYVQENTSSKFPRDMFGHYNGGPNNTQLTVLNVLNGTIGGAHQIVGNTTFAIPSVSGTPNAFQMGIVSLEPDDTLDVAYGGIFTSVSGVMADENIPLPPKTNLQIGGFIISTDGVGNIQPLVNLEVPFPILWRRPYLNTGIALGVQPNFFQEYPAGAIDGVNATFTLSNAPVNANSVFVTVDGILLKSNEWSLSGQQITLVTPPGIAQAPPYVTYISVGQSTVSGYQETPIGLIDGVNQSFVLSQYVANRASLNVYINGRIISNDQWTLIQGISQSTIVFNAGSQPAIAQSIYATYFVNINSVLSNNGGGGGGGGGAAVPYGTTAMPLVISPSVGIPTTSDQRQVRFVRGLSMGGAQPITANPQVTAGTILGQELILFGTSDTDYPVLNDGTGLSLNGPMNLTNKAMIYLMWDGTEWAEISRK